MNTKELIEKTKRQILFEKECLKVLQAVGHSEERQHVTERIDYYESLIAVLNRSRIRITKDELPTGEDATFDTSMYEKYVLAKDLSYDAWMEVPYKHVEGHSEAYPMWTHVPEVSP